MNLVLAKHVDTLVNRAEEAARQQNTLLAWRLLEEGHIFSQSLPGSHLYVHWEMFRLARREGNHREALGQIVRFLLAAPASILRMYPQGNTGRSNVGLFTPMPISDKVLTKMRELDRLEQKRIESGGQLEPYQRRHPLRRR